MLVATVRLAPGPGKGYSNTMNTFSVAVLIYNPKSTGEAESKAKIVAKELEALGLRTVLSPTRHAGHAITLAREAALGSPRPLIVSVSGDGGYNEVINGVMSALEEFSQVRPVVAVVAAGNANDHERTMRSDVSLAELVRAKKVKPLDLLRLTVRYDGEIVQRYAHSYIGLGLSAEGGKAINESEKGSLNEASAILQTLRNHEPFLLYRPMGWRRYDSLIFANIPEMAKVIKLSKYRRVRDGQFDVLAIPHHSWWNVISTLLKSVVGVHPGATRRARFDARVRNCPLIQLDGEVIEVPKEYQLQIVARKQVLESLYQ